MVLGPATGWASIPGKAANEDLMKGAIAMGRSLSELVIREGDVYTLDFAPFLPTHFCQLLSSSLGMGVRVAE